MTGGGTGGHLAIVRAVKEQCVSGGVHNDGGSALIYIGSTQGQDRQWFEHDDDFSMKYFLETKGVVNQRGLGRLGSLWMLFKAFLEARKLLKKHQAKVVFSVGGFSSAATAFAAKSLRIPLVIHEQNAALGSLNKLLKPYATTFLSSYEPESLVKAYPIQQIFFDKARVRDVVNTILFLGGSQGAQAINTLALDLAPELHRRGIRILHQAGERNLESVRAEYRALGIEAEVFGFTDALARLMEQADFAVARAGASTLWELAANGLPTLFIPYPYAAGDHQYYNAKFLVDKSAAWVIRESKLNKKKVLDQLREDLRPISQKLMDLSDPDGAVEIARLINCNS
jgi:UDP-N-acetylglucosamine--N-acetylmuramyl-(pentapeptide) pyrophosphoryl-undecaprenol N-acetylglucosamine transferase